MSCPGPQHWPGTEVQVPPKTPQLGTGVCDMLRSPMLPCPHLPSLKMTLSLCFFFYSKTQTASFRAYTSHFVSFSCFLSLLQQLVPAQSTWHLEELLPKTASLPTQNSQCQLEAMLHVKPLERPGRTVPLCCPPVSCRENHRGSSLGHKVGRIEREKHSVMGIQGGKGQCPLKGLWARNGLDQYTGLLQQRPEASWAQVMTLWLTLIHTDPASCGSLQQPLDPSLIWLMAQLVTDL